jgi:hypothetical protein
MFWATMLTKLRLNLGIRKARPAHHAVFARAHRRVLVSRALISIVGVVAVVTVGAGCGSATDDRPAKWSLISATIVEPSCATVSCHSAISVRGGVDLHAREIGYYTLVNGFYVIPGHPESSALVSLMNAQGSLRMPPDVPLSTDDIDLIENWIAAGAPNN